MLDLSWQSRAAAIYFAFKQISQSLPSILFLEENYKGSRPNSDESTRLSYLGWSIICRMDYFAWFFSSSYCCYFMVYWVGGTVVSHCLILTLNSSLTSSSQLLMWIMCTFQCLPFPLEVRKPVASWYKTYRCLSDRDNVSLSLFFIIRITLLS